MDFLSFQYSPFWLIAFALLALLGAIILYRGKSNVKPRPEYLKYLMAGFRFSVIFCLAAFLLVPLLKQLTSEERKPLVVIAQDASASIGKSLGLEKSKKFAAQLRTLKSNLESKYRVAYFNFGNDTHKQITDTFNLPISDLSKAVDYIQDQFTDQDLKGVVFATDGIFNQGSNPIYNIQSLQAPIYPIALGDTTPSRDLLIKNIYANEFAYLEDQFTVQVDISAQALAGIKTNLDVFEVEGGQRKKLQSFPISISKNDFFFTQDIILDADKIGVRQYSFELSNVNNENTTKNNRKQAFIEVLDARQKVLIVAASPHPDLSAMKQSILNNKNYDVELSYPDKLPNNVQDFDLLILHQLPSKDNAFNSFIQNWKKDKKPLLFVVGNETDLNELNKNQNIVDIISKSNSTNLIQASPTNNFNLFTLSEESKNQISKYLPLSAPFADFQTNPESQILALQKIGKVDTQYPLIAFLNQEGQKEAIIIGTGIWKWRMLDYTINENFSRFDELLFKTVQYQTVKSDKRRFKVNVAKKIFNESEPLDFIGELYNESYELVNEPEVNLTITNQNGDNFPFTLNRKGKSYHTQIASMGVGNYTFVAETVFNGEKQQVNGKFTISAIEKEFYDLVANHGLLKNMAKQTGGQLFNTNSLASLESTLLESDAGKPILYQSLKTDELLNHKWIFFLLLFALSIEWFLRRFFGGY